MGDSGDIFSSALFGAGMEGGDVLGRVFIEVVCRMGEVSQDCW